MASLAATVAVTTKRFSGHINQLGKAQDYSSHGFSYDKNCNFNFMVVCDGHGTQINSISNIRNNKIIDAFTYNPRSVCSHNEVNITIGDRIAESWPQFFNSI